MTILKKSSQLILILAATCSLQACVNVAMSSAQATYSRYSLASSMHDEYLTVQVDRALHWKSNHFQDYNLSINTFNNVVVITGQVSTLALKNEITHIVKQVPDVEEVYNFTTIEANISSLTHVSDSWITTKIKSQLIAEVNIDPSQIKVITENGTVYLMGIILPEQADIATEVARTTEGVQKVVKIFSYIHISKKYKGMQ